MPPKVEALKKDQAENAPFNFTEDDMIMNTCGMGMGMDMEMSNE